jgi:hypothetical protein
LTKKLVRRQLLCWVLAVCVSVSAAAETKPKRSDVGAVPASILWVENSFFYYEADDYRQQKPPLSR